MKPMKYIEEVIWGTILILAGALIGRKKSKAEVEKIESEVVHNEADTDFKEAETLGKNLGNLQIIVGIYKKATEDLTRECIELKEQLKKFKYEFDKIMSENKNQLSRITVLEQENVDLRVRLLERDTEILNLKQAK